MSDIDKLKAVVDQWNNGLDNGDIERMVSTCDSAVVTVNSGQPMTVGVQAVRDKYIPRIAAAKITSGFDYEHIEVFGDVAVVVGQFNGQMEDRQTGQVRNAEGRLTIVYRRTDDGSWKMILDMDNNA